jgi:hypothetical protein
MKKTSDMANTINPKGQTIGASSSSKMRRRSSRPELLDYVAGRRSSRI